MITIVPSHSVNNLFSARAPAPPPSAQQLRQSEWSTENKENLAPASNNATEGLGIKKGHTKLATFIYEKMYTSKSENDDFSKTIAKEYGGKVITAPMKTIDRALTKISNDYGGDMGKIKDLTRTTVIINSDKVDNVVSDLEKKGGINIKKIDGNVDPLGYSGINATYKSTVGGNCEMQVITPAMIFGKMNASTAKSMLGEDYCRRLEETSGQKGGLGHKFYEQYRTLDPSSSEAKDIAQQSKNYYAAIRGSELAL